MKLNESMLYLYAVTDRAWTQRQSLFEQVEAAIRGGAGCVQLREKDMPFDDFLAEAIEMKALCNRFGVPLIINDSVEIALKSGADGVHVGQEDMLAADVRARIGENMILGVTAKTVEQAIAAQRAGADYLGSGAVFGSATKTNARPMPLATLAKICRAVTIPVVAIGGVNKSNLHLLAGSGIRGAAVVSGIFAAQDIEAECRHLRAMAEEIVRG